VETATAQVKRRKFEDAAENFLKASQNYRLVKRWGESGSALVQAGECASANKDRFNAADYYKRAVNDLEKCPERAVQLMTVLRLSANISEEDGKASMAAHTLKSLATREEKEGKLTEAIADWLHAAELFGEEKINSWQCRGEAGRLQLYASDWKSALATFETLGKEQSDGEETPGKRVSSARSYWYASLCQLASNSAEAALEAITEYGIQAPSFQEGAQGKLMLELAGFLNESEFEKYDARLARYVEFSPLPAAERRMFALARDNCEKNGPGRDGELDGDPLGELAGGSGPAVKRAAPRPAATSGGAGSGAPLRGTAGASDLDGLA